MQGARVRFIACYAVIRGLGEDPLAISSFAISSFAIAFALRIGGRWIERCTGACGRHDGPDA